MSGTMVVSLGDAHIYSNHHRASGATQLARTPKPSRRLATINRSADVRTAFMGTDLTDFRGQWATSPPRPFPAPSGDLMQQAARRLLPYGVGA